MDTIDTIPEKETARYEEEIERLKKELEQAHEQTRYLTADFENVRRRIEKEWQHIGEARQLTLLLDILTIVDDFDRAFIQAEQRPELKPYLIGFELIHKALQKLLAKYQVSEITQLSVFDPELHEAVLQEEDSTKKSGDIIRIVQKGYLYKDKVLRPAHVTVNP